MPRCRRVQPTDRLVSAHRTAWRSAASATALLLLAGCSATPKAINPVSWWHGLEGGAIAQNRPPPPRANAPYPHIAAAPTRPAGMPDWEWQDLQKTLAAQGAAAHSYAAQNPIPTLPQNPTGTARPAAASPAAASPAAAKPVPAPAATAGTAAPAPAADQEAIQRLAAAQGPTGAAASTPPAATVAAASAASSQPATAGSSVTLGAPDNTAAPGQGPAQVPVNAAGQVATTYKPFDANNGLSIPGALSPVAQQDEAHPPPLPTSVPAPARVPGFAIPAVPSTYVPPKAAAEPAPYVPPAPLPDVAPVTLSFQPGSAILSPPMQRALASLANQRKDARIAVTGFGGAAAGSLAAQSAAMPLALERARAITVQLMADGVPPARLATTATAEGQGGLARLVD